MRCLPGRRAGGDLAGGGKERIGGEGRCLAWRLGLGWAGESELSEYSCQGKSTLGQSGEAVGLIARYLFIRHAGARFFLSSFFFLLHRLGQRLKVHQIKSVCSLHTGLAGNRSVGMAGRPVLHFEFIKFKIC